MENKQVTWNEFYNVLYSINAEIERFFRGINVKIELANEPHVMNCWLVDHQNVIFGFPRVRQAKEIALITTDKNLIKHINDTFNEIGNIVH
jgi:hypothetical protein